MMQMQEPTTLWGKVRTHINKQIAGIIDRRHVEGFEDDGRIRTSSLDPDETGEQSLTVIRPSIGVGDDVLTLRVGKRRVILGAIHKAGDVEVTYVSELGGDGVSPAAARADHEHTGPGDASLEVGTRAKTTLRGHAVGYEAEAGDAATAVGFLAKALGYIGTALGFQASAGGERATAAGYLANASGQYATAIGSQSVASALRAWAIGYLASNATPDTGKFMANDIYFERSNGTGHTRIVLRSPDGAWKVVSFDSDGNLVVGSRNYGTQTGLFPVNKTISSGTADSLRLLPSSTGTVIRLLGAGTTVFDTGIRISADSISWAYVFAHGCGWGYYNAARLI